MSMTGIVLKGIGGFYYVQGQDGGIYTLHAQSKLRSKRIGFLLVAPKLLILIQ